MQRVWAVVFGVLSLVGCSREPATPLLIVPNSIRELGSIPLGRREVAFRLQNRGTADLTIKKVATSCGCTRTKLDKSTISPGQEAQLIAVVTPLQPEERSAQIQLFSDDPQNSILDLRLSWSAKGPFDVSPAVLDFGVVRPNVESKKLLTVKPNREVSSSFHIQEVRAAPRELMRIDRSNGPDEVTLEVTLKTDSIVKSDGMIHVDFLSDSGDASHILVPVTWKMREAVEATPSRLFLGTSQVGKIVSGEIVLSSDEGTTMQLGDLSLTSDWNMKLTQERLSSNSVQVRIEASVESEGIASSILRIPVKSPEAKILEVPISAVGLK